MRAFTQAMRDPWVGPTGAEELLRESLTGNEADQLFSWAITSPPSELHGKLL
jgi:hypothetical protein